MLNYRRWFVPGGTYFFTANLVCRDFRLLIEHIDSLRAAYGEAARRQPFKTVAICGIWQRRYWEHVITDADDLAAHINYIHFNPVKHGLVADVADWPFSSWRRWKGQAG